MQAKEDTIPGTAEASLLEDELDPDSVIEADIDADADVDVDSDADVEVDVRVGLYVGVSVDVDLHLGIGVQFVLQQACLGCSGNGVLLLG